MSYRLTKIYTRTGDEGETTLCNQRLSKDDLLVDAIGDLDELNAALGLTASFKITHSAILETLTRIQHTLFDLGGELHAPAHPAITDQHIHQLEETLDLWNETLPPLKEFVLPRGSSAVSSCHLARTICRRAERSLVRVHRRAPLQNTALLRYLNRLSDLLFVMARMIALENQDQEVMWDHERHNK